MRSTAIHDTLSKGRLSWICLIIFIIKLTFHSSAYAQPQGKQMPDRDTRARKPFLVDLKINQQDNRAGGLVGMVTTDDLLDLLAAELSMLAGLVVEQPIKEERTRK